MKLAGVAPSFGMNAKLVEPNPSTPLIPPPFGTGGEVQEAAVGPSSWDRLNPLFWFLSTVTRGPERGEMVLKTSAPPQLWKVPASSLGQTCPLSCIPQYTSVF